LLVLSQESGKILNVDRSGTVFSSLTISADPRNTANSLDTLTVPNQSHEGITVDKNGILYVVSENGGGGMNNPELWVYAPTQASVPLVNQAPTALLLSNAINTIPDKTSTTTRFKISDIDIVDDGLGTNNFTLTGADAASFEIFQNALYIKAGTTIDFKTKASYNVSVNVDDPTVGTTTPDAFKAFTLSITDPNPATNAGGIYVTEVAPWASGNSPVLADWFELTNTSKAAIDITGWKFNDNHNSFAVALPLNGISSIAAGESVVFVEATSDTATSNAIDRFKSNWFGANVPAGFRIGSYSGAGSGLSTAGDAVNIYNAAGDLKANVVFGGSPLATPFATFDNAKLDNNVTFSTLSAAGVNGAFSIDTVVNSLKYNEIGSPGSAKIVPKTTRNDFGGDGKSDILWRNDDGRVSLWQMNGAAVIGTESIFTSVPTAWKIADSGDFDGDKKSDILWRNTDGSVAIWQMDGTTATAKKVIGDAATTWQISGTGDFNGDKKSDILWRNNDGQVAIWQMDGTTPTKSVVTSATATTDWKIAGTGDFDGDGKSDILWRKSDGSVSMWQMNGNTTRATDIIGYVTNDWKIAGTGDFNGDSKADILWRNDDGRVAIWQMNGTTATKSVVGSAVAAWKIAGTGDFNGDGTSDILWRHDNGAVETWQMNNNTIASAGLVNPIPFVETSWKISAPVL
jgi:hypothetical protein